MNNNGVAPSEGAASGTDEMKHFALIAVTGSLLALGTPGAAAELPAKPTPLLAMAENAAMPSVAAAAWDDDDWDDDRRWRGRGRDWDDRRWRGRGRDRNWDDDRGWRGRDVGYWRDDRGRWRCRRNDGTTGLLVGAGVGALAGRAIDTRGDRTLGTLLGAVGGGLIGREIERGGVRCR